MTSEATIPSANGYLIEVDGYTLASSWAAPFYVLSRSEGPHGPDEPILYHCDSLDAARSRRGTILNADFSERT